MKNELNKQKFFTLFEMILILVAVIIFISFLVVENNPAKKSADLRNQQRREDVKNILTAVRSYASDHNGNWPDTITDNETEICSEKLDCNGLVKLKNDLVPKYLNDLPIDPKFVQENTSSIGYSIYYSSKIKQIVVLSPYAENSASISLPR